jgi:putative tricarboxylic transport membrane protein
MATVTRMMARVCAAAALAIVALSPAHAQYPEKNIDLIVPYGPGGGFDLYARAVGKAMEN